MGQVKATRTELQLGLLCEWQGPVSLSPHLLPARVRISRRLNRDFIPDTLILDAA